ncbi:heterokaryon incompatibility protein-domain-containing protein [Alternaria alternata]|nr:heterokaryon incompatibility protein-domain-containing protein [Alternaria alternata]
MYLINTTTIKIRPFIGIIPKYVILSHTWDEDEVTFESMQRPNERTKALKGYMKIKRCCEQAKQDGYRWAWVDTCCIDKRSSAELSEAINSMYRYYWGAEKCYAYLTDVEREIFQFLNSRWFKRGWTLQELLAPATLEFYDQEWNMIGTKFSLATFIQVATEIQAQYILDRNAMKGASIGLRLSWASQRDTTRDEDQAYCLFGIMGVNMPLLYGEGKRAFYRLQVELLKNTMDHTIFAWSLGSSFSLGPKSPCQFVYRRRYKVVHTMLQMQDFVSFFLASPKDLTCSSHC